MRLRHLARFGSSIALVSCFASVLVTGKQARACSEPEPGPGYLSLGAHEPLDGAPDVALDSTVVIDLHYQPWGSETELSVVLSDELSGDVVEGELLSLHWERPLVSFRPSRELAPNTAYRVTAIATSALERPDGAEGVEELDLSFTTGGDLLPVLEQIGELLIGFEDYERESYPDCGGLCSCDPTGTLVDTRAVLELPAARGGQAQRGYSVTVRAVDEKGAVMNVDSAIVFEEPGSSLSLGRLRGDAAYSPCFELQISDVSGNALEDQVLCVNDSIPRLGEPIPYGDAGSPAEPDAGGTQADAGSDEDAKDDDATDDDAKGDDDASGDPHAGEANRDDTNGDEPANGDDGCQMSAARAPSSTAGSIAALFALGLIATRRRREHV